MDGTPRVFTRIALGFVLLEAALVILSVLALGSAWSPGAGYGLVAYLNHGAWSAAVLAALWLSFGLARRRISEPAVRALLVCVLGGGLTYLLCVLFPPHEAPIGVWRHPFFGEPEASAVGGTIRVLPSVALAVSTFAFSRFASVFPRALVAADYPAARAPKNLEERTRKMERSLAFIRSSHWWTVAVIIGLISAWVPMMAALVFVSASLGLDMIRIQFLKGSKDDRSSVAWLVVAAECTVVLFVVFTLLLFPILRLSSVDQVLASVWLGWLLTAPSVVPIMWIVLIGCAVLRDGPVDPAPIVHGIAAYGTLTTVALALFVALESLVTDGIESILGAPGPWGMVLTSVMAATVVLLLRSPVKSVASGLLTPGKE